MDYDFLKEWVSKLSIPNPNFGNWPICPFAKKVLDSNKVKITFNDRDINIKEDEVWIFVYDRDICSEHLLLRRNVLNAEHPELIFMEDHCDCPEVITGVSMNNGKYNIIIGQHRTKIREARRTLHEKNYYENWSHQDYNEIMSI